MFIVRSGSRNLTSSDSLLLFKPPIACLSKFLLLCFFWSSAGTTFAPAQQEQSEGENARIDALALQAGELYSKGDFNGARRLAERILEFDKKRSGGNPKELLGTLEFLRMIDEANRDLPKLSETLRQELESRIAVFGSDSPQVASTKRRLAFADERLGLSEPENTKLWEADEEFKAATIQFQKGRHTEAIKLARAASQKRLEILGDQHLEYASSLGNLAQFLKEAGDLSESLELNKKTLEIVRNQVGEETVAVARCLNNIGTVLDALGEYELANENLEKSLEIRRKIHGPNSIEVAIVLNNIGSIHFMRDELAKALDRLSQALKIIEDHAGKQRDYASIMNSIGTIYEKMGRFPEAEKAFLESTQLHQELLGEGHHEYAADLANLAGYYKAIGDLGQAKILQEKSLLVHEKVFGEDSLQVAVSLNSLGLLYRQLGDLERAKAELKRCVQIRSERLGKSHPSTAVSLSNLALVFLDAGDIQEAQSLFLQVESIRANNPGKDSLDYASTLLQLAEILERQGELEQAEKNILKAKEIRYGKLGAQHPSYAHALSTLALFYKNRQHYEHAEVLYREALSIFERSYGKQHQNYVRCVGNLAALLEAADKPGAAELYLEALRSSMKNLDAYAAIQSQAQQILTSSTQKYLLDRLMRYLLSDDAKVMDGYEQLLNWKGRVQTRRQLYRKLAQNEDSQPLWIEFQEAARQVAKFRQKSTEADVSSGLRAAQKRLEEAEAALAGEFSSQELNSRVVSLTEIQNSLPEDTVLVDFLILDNHDVVAAIVSKVGSPVLKDLGSLQELITNGNRWRTAIRAGELARHSAQRVRQQIWDPIAANLDDASLVLISTDGYLSQLPFNALPGTKEGSFLIEEKRLAFVPIPRLLAGSYIDNMSIQNSQILLVGDVDFEKATREGSVDGVQETQLAFNFRSGLRELRNDFQPLPATKLELASIQALALNSGIARHLILSGPQASERNVKHFASGATHLHFATHGYFEPKSQDQNKSYQRNPELLSGLALAGSNRSIDVLDPAMQEDGILTPLEVETLDLLKTDLVVLSACDTGLGVGASGEGILGLQRSFQISGARTVISSLWKIDDRATQAMMTELYRNLLVHKMNKIDSLRAAQLAMLRGFNLETSDLSRGRLTKGSSSSDQHQSLPDEQTNGPLPPIYWAAFQLSGSWR